MVGGKAPAGQEIANLESWSYSSDILTLGDPFAVAVPDPRGKWRGKLNVGDPIDFSLSHQDVANGAKTLKVSGIITERTCTSENGRGTVIMLKCADLGYHLVHNDAPIWMNLKGIKLDKLIDACVFPERRWPGKASATGWGFKGVRIGNIPNRIGKKGKKARGVLSAHAATRSEQTLNSQASVLTPIAVIQAEPGEKIADLLIAHARRLGWLINVSFDGWLQIFRPDYSQNPSYTIEYHAPEDVESVRNNVQNATMTENLDSIYTEVFCVGEVVWKDVTLAAASANDPNAGKFKGRWHPSPSPLPFAHRVSFTDGERTTRAQATQRAKWRYERGLFDSWTAIYEVRGHGQNGVWWEADTMVHVNDTINGIVGNYYVQAVRCDRTMQKGDVTTVIVKRPGLLAA